MPQSSDSSSLITKLLQERIERSFGNKQFHGVKMNRTYSDYWECSTKVLVKEICEVVIDDFIVHIVFF